MNTTNAAEIEQTLGEPSFEPTEAELMRAELTRPAPFDLGHGE